MCGVLSSAVAAQVLAKFALPRVPAPSMGAAAWPQSELPHKRCRAHGIRRWFVLLTRHRIAVGWQICGTQRLGCLLRDLCWWQLVCWPRLCTVCKGRGQLSPGCGGWPRGGVLTVDIVWRAVRLLQVVITTA